MFNPDMMICPSFPEAIAAIKAKAAAMCSHHTPLCIYISKLSLKPENKKDKAQPINDHRSKSGKPEAAILEASVKKPLITMNNRKKTAKVSLPDVRKFDGLEIYLLKITKTSPAKIISPAKSAVKESSK